MANCPKCGHSEFECEMIAFKNLNVSVCVVYCSACKVAIGTFDPTMHDKINKIMDSLNLWR
jgi:hypothetical protein